MEMRSLLDEARARPSFAVTQRVGRRLSELITDELRAAAGPRAVRVAVLSSFTIEQIVPYLTVMLLERDVVPDLYVPDFNQFQQQIRLPTSELYAFRPDICFLHVQLEALVPGVRREAPPPEQIAAAAEEIAALAREFRSHSGADLVVSDFASPITLPYAIGPDPAAEGYRDLNARVRSALATVPGCTILDFDLLTAYHGKVRLADERLRHIARMELSAELMPRLATKMTSHALALRGLGRKCVVLDLDGILWGGVVGEDGPAGIALGPEFPGSVFLEFQRALTTLLDRGVLLALNSKNNQADALEILERHPSMVLRADDFAATRINWSHKHENMDAIAEELNIGLDALVFIDDSPVERELMRRLRPEVLTPEWPPDPVHYVQALRELPDLHVKELTHEDASRARMYVEEKQRRSVQGRSGTLTEYLAELAIQLDIRMASAVDLPRVTQMINKTNQFNLTTKRYASAEVAELHADGWARIYVLSARDAFGDYGLVGVAIVRIDSNDHVWTIDSLLMSCRVLGRTIEHAFLDHLVREAARSGAISVVGEFSPTAKNEQVASFYREAGFEDTGDGRRWLVAPSAYRGHHLPWLRLTDPSPLARS